MQAVNGRMAKAKIAEERHNSESVRQLAGNLRIGAARKGIDSEFAEHVEGVARNLWEKGHDGSGEIRTIQKHTGGKWLIAQEESPAAPEFKTLVLYPRPEHANAFAKAMESTVGGGPSEYYPGAVGCLQYREIPGRQTLITFIQGAYRQKDAEGNDLVPRTLATKYGGWRENLLKHVFSRAEEQRIPKVTLNLERPKLFVVTAENLKGGARNVEKFTKEAQSRGYSVRLQNRLMESKPTAVHAERK